MGQFGLYVMGKVKKPLDKTEAGQTNVTSQTGRKSGRKCSFNA